MVKICASDRLQSGLVSESCLKTCAGHSLAPTTGSVEGIQALRLDWIGVGHTALHTELGYGSSLKVL